MRPIERNESLADHAGRTDDAYTILLHNPSYILSNGTPEQCRHPVSADQLQGRMVDINLMPADETMLADRRIAFYQTGPAFL